MAMKRHFHFLVRSTADQLYLIDTLASIKRLQEAGFTPIQAEALAYVTNRIACAHLAPLLPTTLLSPTRTQLSSAIHSLLTSLTTTAHTATLSVHSAHNRAASLLHASLDGLGDSAANCKVELGMLVAAGRVEVREWVGEVELGTAREEAGAAAMATEIRGRLDKGKVTVIAAFIGAMVTCFAAISWKKL